MKLFVELLLLLTFGSLFIGKDFTAIKNYTGKFREDWGIGSSITSAIVCLIWFTKIFFELY